jgi:Tfp pilus assembly protein PilN
MIKINLLSPSDKLSAKWEKINHLIISNFIILIIGQLVLLLIFLISIKYLDIESGNLDKQFESIQVQAEVKEIEEIKVGISECENQLGSILNLQENRYVFTGTLEDFSKIIPAGVKINSIDIKPKISETFKKTKRDYNKRSADDKNKFDFNITGIVSSRENLLKFENSLRNSEVFSDLIIDLSNYDSENNNFRYSMTVDMNL